MRTRSVLRRLATVATAALLTTGGALAAATPAQAAGPRVGQVVCHSSQVYGWQCGSVTQTNLTIRYPGGTIYGVFRYRACAGPGDSDTRVYDSSFETVGFVMSGNGYPPHCYTYAVPA